MGSVATKIAYASLIAAVFVFIAMFALTRMHP
jgi:hypothetical protein